MKMNNYKKSALILLLVIIIFEIAVAYIGNIANRPEWGDEIRLYETVIEFGESITLDRIKHYPQMSTPLPFIIYSLWGKLFGFDLFTLRILSIIIALLTYLIFHRILFESTNNIHLSFLGTIFLMIHPYMVGLSIFVFTDMLAILFFLLSYWALKHDRTYFFALALALSILCRQYMLFFLPAVSLYYLVQWIKDKKTQQLQIIAASIISAIPYLCLIILWGGTSPDNEFRQLYLSERFNFKPDIFYLYIALLFVYLLPYYFFIFKKFYKNKQIIILSIILSFGYFLFPIKPSKYSIDIGVYTVGLFHKGLKYLNCSDNLVQIIFYLSVLLGLSVFLTIGKEIIKKIQNNNFDQTLLVDLTILFFFIVMPFSYLGWEKYFMPILPFVILRFSKMTNKQVTQKSF